MQAGHQTMAGKAQAALQQLHALPGTQRVALPAFDLQQTAQQVSAAFGDAEVGGELAREVFARTSGLPAFIEQARPRLESLWRV